MAGKLKCARRGVIPLAEVSTLALQPAGADWRLVAMGDRGALLAAADISDVLRGVATWEVTDLASLPGRELLPGDRSQAEALAAAGPSRMVVLWEHPNVLVIAEADRLTASSRLVVDQPASLAGSWDDPGSSHGEGLVLLKGARALVAKEKDPLALIEFAPAGSGPSGFGPGQWLPAGQPWQVPPAELVATTSWQPPKEVRIRDLSDATVGPAGELLVLSDRDEAVHVVSSGLPADRSFQVVASYRLAGLSGKPEGIAVAPDGTLLIATDDEHGRDNLFAVPPGWMTH